MINLKNKTILIFIVFLFFLEITLAKGANLPIVGGDNDQWGTILNDYLQIEHDANGSHTNVTALTINSSGNITTSDSMSISKILRVGGNFIIDTLGRVGIGTTNPSSALNVTGNIGATGNITADVFFGDGSGLTGLIASTYNATYDKFAYNQTIGAINYITSGGSLTSVQGNNTYIKIGGALTNYNNIALTNKSNVFFGNITIKNNLTVGLNTLYVDSANGRVGIGTTNPSSALNVTGNIGATGNITADVFFGDGSKLTGIVSGSTADGTINSSAWNRTSGKVFLANGNDKVGIGTTNPSSALNVTGNIGATGNVTADFFYGDGSGLTGLIASTYNATYDKFAYNQTIGAINYITSGGYINSAQGNNTYIKLNGALADYNNIALTNQSNVFFGNITIKNNLTVGLNTLYVDSANGRVGIGTTKSTSALNVTGNIGATGNITADVFFGDGSKL